MCESLPVMTVYGKPGCVQCERSTWLLKRDNAPHVYVDVTEDEGAFDYVKNTLGYMGVPVCVVDYGGGVNTHWTGFRPDKLNGFVAKWKSWERGRDDS